MGGALKIRKWLFYVFIAILSAIALPLIVIVAFYWITPLQRWAVQRAIDSTRLPISIEYSRLRFGWDFIEIDEPLILFRDEGTEILFRADSLRALFDIKKKTAYKLFIFYPSVKITSKGATQEGTRETAFKLPVFFVDTLLIRSGKFEMDDFSINSLLYRGSIASSGDTLHLVLDSLSGDLPGRGFVRHARGSVALYGGIDIDLWVELRKSALDVKGTISNFDPIAWHFKAGGENVELSEVDSLLDLGFLVGSGKVAIDLYGKGESVDGSVFVDGSIFDIPAGNVSCRLRYADDRLQLTNLRGIAWGSPMQGKLEIRFHDENEPFDILIEGEVLNLDLNAFIPDSSLRSNLSGKATISGQILDSLVSLTIEGNLGAGDILGIAFDEARGSLFVSNDSVVFYPGFEVMSDLNYLTFEGTIAPEGELFIQFGLWARDLSKIASLADIGDIIGGRARFENAQIFGSLDSVLFSAEITSDSLVTSIFEHSDFLAEVTLYDLTKNPRGNIYIESEGAFAGIPYDSAMTNIEIHGNRFYVKPFQLWGDSLSAKGIAEINNLADTTTVQAEGFELALFNRPIELESTFTITAIGEKISSTPLFAKTLDGNIIVSGFVGDDKSISFNAKIDRIKLGTLEGLLPLEGIKGDLSGSLFMSIPREGNETFGNFSLHIDDFQTKGTKWQKAQAEINLRSGVVSLEPLLLSTDSDKFTASGWVAIYDSTLPFSFDIKGQGKRLDIFTNYIAGIDSVVGKFDINLFVAGNKDSLYADGFLGLKSGVLGLELLADPIESLDLKLSLDGNEIVIDTLTGIIGAMNVESGSLWERFKRLFTKRKKEYGRFYANGSIDISKPATPNFDIGFSAKKLPINLPEGGIFTRFNTDLKIAGRDPIGVDGTVQIVNANIVKLGTGGGGEMDSIPVSLSILLEIPGNAWILTNLLETEISGNMNIITEQKSLALYGELSASRGKVFFYGKTFHIEEGGIYFESIERINPRLSIRAVTNAGGVRIIADITGTLEDPRMALSAEDASGNPIPYSQREIISLIALNSALAEGDSTAIESVIEQRLPQVLQGYITRGVESVARTTLGVETFEFTPSEANALDLSQANITIGKYLTDRIYLRYTRSLSFEEGSGDVINLEYRLTDHFSLEAKREASFDQADKYRLDLKFKWEY